MRSLAFLALLSLASARVSYEGFEVWRLEVESKQHLGLRQFIEEHNIDVWAQGRDWLDVMVSPEQNRCVNEELAMLGVHSRIHINDLQALVERDYAAQEGRSARAPLNFEVYNLWEDIEAYLLDLPNTDSRTSVVSLGQSVEGRDLLQLKIAVGGDKPSVWLDCGIHAREWITPATCLWGINYLLTGYGSNQAATDLLDAYDIYILPVLNPDGYAYTQEDRMWRKNRNLYEGDLCVGVDLNRNFEEQYGGLGTSDDSCSQVYKGPGPASEPEIKAVQAGIVSLASSANVLFTFHSYGQYWMYPFSYTYDLPPEAAELDAVAKIGVDALTAVNGTVFTYGPVADLVSPAAGATEDFSYAAGITYSFSLELRDRGRYGFLLPEDLIAPTATETWAGLIAATLATP